MPIHHIRKMVLHRAAVRLQRIAVLEFICEYTEKRLGTGRVISVCSQKCERDSEFGRH